MEVTDILHKPNADESEKTTVTYFYVLSGSPYFTITSIKHKKLLTLSKVKGSKNLPIRKKAYFKKIKSTLTNVRNNRKLSAVLVKACKKLSQERSTVLIKAYKFQELNAVFDHLKYSYSIVYIQSDLMLFFSSHLKTLNRKSKKLKPPVILRALKCLCLNCVSAEEGVCIYSLETFLRHSLKSRKLRHLLKDVAADILSELYVCTKKNRLKSSAVSWLPQTFRNPRKKRLEVLYGAVIGGLANMTIETDAKIVPCDAFYDEQLSKRVINSLKLFNKIMCVCESFIYCCITKDLFLNQNETDSLYDLNALVVVLYNLIRNATLHTPISFVKYDQSTSKTFQLSHLLLDRAKLRRLLNGVTSNRKKRQDRNKNSSKPTTQTLISKSSYDGKKSSLERKDYIFWNYFDVFDIIRTRAIDYEKIFFGHDSVQYRYEKASVCSESSHVILPLYFDVFNVNNVKEGMYQYPRLKGKKNVKKRKLAPVKY